MRFDRIRLENFKCYEETDVRLNAGVTVIHGLNGSGKSSLLEACFFALYGSKALEKTLDEIVTIGAEETRVELEFTHDGESYQIRRRLRVRDGNARTAECVLEGPGEPVEGATDVRNRVTELLRMDTEAFVNCAYVRQGEVNKLINASPSVRQDMIDDLLQLGKLEEYRERASDARVGVGRVRDDKQGALSELDEQIEAKEAKNLHARKNELQEQLDDVKGDIDRFETNRKNAEQARDQAQSIIDEYEDKREELAAVEEDIEDLRERIQETERTREELAEKLDSKRTARTEAEQRRETLTGQLDAVSEESTDDEIEEQIAEIERETEELTEQIKEKSVEKQQHDSEEQSLREQADERETQAAEAREEADDLEAELETAREKIEQKRSEIEEMAEEIEANRAEFDDAAIDFGEARAHEEAVAEDVAELRETRAQRQATLENERERVDEAESLLAEGKCPECGQPVEESPHVDAIDDHRDRVAELEAELEDLDERETALQEKHERAEELVDCEETVETLESNRDNLEQLLDERESGIEAKAERIEELRERAAEASEKAEEKREHAAAAAERATACQKAIAEYNREKGELSERLDDLEALADVRTEIEDLTEEMETIREQRAEKESINDERRERLAEKRDRREELGEEFDEDRIETAREEKQKAVDYLEGVTEKLEQLEERKSTLQGRVGAVENELEELEELRDRRETVEATLDQLESLHSETADLEEMYGQLRAELRRQNVATLERMLNETFELVYENDTYSRIELDGEYRLTIYQKDGEELDPDQLSGGERALFNLSLRCAIYQLLAEGIEGAAPMPPLILDEPTVFLDSGHVTQLVELVDSMRDRGVEQILVVSHDDELVGAADDLVTVRKDSTTNRSTVEHEPEKTVLEA